MTEADKKKITEIAKRYNLDLLTLFGSQVSGFTHKDSDVDVAYLSPLTLSFDNEASLNIDLIEVFKNENISTVDLKKAPPLLLAQIVNNAVVLYEKTPHIFNEIFLYALRAYEEAKPLFELREQYLTRRINEYKHAG